MMGTSDPSVVGDALSSRFPLARALLYALLGRHEPAAETQEAP